MLRLVHGLNTIAPTIQAAAAVAATVLTAVLAWITARYVRLTRDLVATTREELELLRADRATSAAERRVRLQAMILNVRIIATSLPRNRDHAEAIVNAPLWSPSDPDIIANLAAAYGTSAAELAAEATRHLAVLRELATAAQSEPQIDTITWERLPWDRWNEAIGGAERSLTSVATMVARVPAP